MSRTIRAMDAVMRPLGALMGADRLVGEGWWLIRKRRELQFLGLFFVGFPTAVFVLALVIQGSRSEPIPLHIILVYDAIAVGILWFIWDHLWSYRDGMMMRRLDLFPRDTLAFVEDVLRAKGIEFELDDVEGLTFLQRSQAHYVYELRLRGSGTRVRIAMVFDLFFKKDASVHSNLEVGPIGRGEDELVEELCEALASAELPELSNVVPWDDLEGEHDIWKRRMTVSWAACLPFMAFYGYMRLVYLDEGDPMTGMWSLLSLAPAGVAIAMTYYCMSQMRALAMRVVPR